MAAATPNTTTVPPPAAAATHPVAANKPAITRAVRAPVTNPAKGRQHSDNACLLLSNHDPRITFDGASMTRKSGCTRAFANADCNFAVDRSLARTMHFYVVEMPTVIRALLWTAVVIAPGGVLLLPLLVLDSRRRQGEAAADAANGGGSP
jgi:hypothetical protein